MFLASAKKSYSRKFNNKTVCKYRNSFLKSKGAHDHPRPETKLEAEARRSIQKAHAAFSPPSPTLIKLQEIKVTFIINKLNCRARDPWCKTLPTRNLVFGWEWVLCLYISFPCCQVQKEQGCPESTAGIPQSRASFGLEGYHITIHIILGTVFIHITHACK